MALASPDIAIGQTADQPAAHEPATSPEAAATPKIIYRLNSPMTAVGVSFARVDWRAALDQLRTEVSSQNDAGFLTITRRRWRPPFDARQAPALTQLNTLTARYFPEIAVSSVPVLLPFDTGALIADTMRGTANADHAHYSADFPKLEMLAAGPSGYDAVYTVPPGKTENLPPRTFSRSIEVQITGSLVTYDIADPSGGKGESIASLATQYPDLRRFIREGYVRYAFTKFGVAYVVSMPCRDIGPRARVLSCREAAPIAERFLRLLRVAGGHPVRAPRNKPAVSVERPQAVHSEFTFLPPGDINPNTGYRRSNGGLADYNSYAQIRFPIETAPAFANSQSFMSWRDCNRAPDQSSKDITYRCRVNGSTSAFYEKSAGGFTYPWRDNFCEARDFQAGQCPAGMGHQGQDIRPARCETRSDGSDHCLPYPQRVVAVRDGVIVRGSSHESAFVLVNETSEHIRFRYLHMNPSQLNSDGVLYGRRVREGEAFGIVSNFQDYPGGTSLHLHFDIQVFTRNGWIWVNPYVTLVSAYERLLRARGREIVPPPAAPIEGPTPEQVSSPDADKPRRAADASAAVGTTRTP